MPAKSSKFYKDNPQGGIAKVMDDLTSKDTAQGQIISVDAVGNYKVKMRGSRTYTQATIARGLSASQNEYVTMTRSADSSKWVITNVFKSQNPKYETQQPADIGCRIYNNTTISIPNNTLTVLTFNTTKYDTDNMHNNSFRTSRITLNRAGKYQFGTTQDWTASATGVRLLRVKINGGTQISYNSTNALSTVGQDTQQQLVDEYIFAAGDYIEVYALQDSGGALNLNAFGPGFTLTFWARKVDGAGS